MSSHSILLNQEKRLLPFHLYVAAEDRYEMLIEKPIYADLWDRDALQFHLWTGHLEPYRILRRALRAEDSLLIVNHHEGNDCPFIYPFIKDRTAENTRIVNLRFGQVVPPDVRDTFDYVLTFKGRLCDPSFSPMFQCDELAIYKNAVSTDAWLGRSRGIAAGVRHTRLR